MVCSLYGRKYKARKLSTVNSHINVTWSSGILKQLPSTQGKRNRKKKKEHLNCKYATHTHTLVNP